MLTFLFIVCVVFAIASGAIIMVWPVRYRELIAALWRMNGQNADLESRHASNWEQRLAGAVIALAGSAVMWRVIHARLAFGASAPAHVPTNAPWLDPLAATVLFLGGLLTLVYPNSIVRWGFRQVYRNEDAERISNYGQSGARLFGIAALTAAALTIYLWTGRNY